MEEAAYELLSLLAERCHDEDALETARRIESQEQGMAERLEGLYDQAVEASLAAKDAADLDEHLTKYWPTLTPSRSRPRRCWPRGLTWPAIRPSRRPTSRT